MHKGPGIGAQSQDLLLNFKASPRNGEPMRKLAVALVAFAFASSAFAAEGPLMMRFRRTVVDPSNGSSAISLDVGATHIGVEKNSVGVESKTIPEVDFTYFILPNVAAELILTHPQKLGVNLNGADLGSVTVLPPCLTAQYHFLPDFVLRPYVGVGANLTLVTAQNLSVDLPVGAGGALVNVPLHIKPSRSLGFVAQAGADLKVTDHVFINLDVKYVTMSFDVKVKGGALDGTKVTTVDVNPVLYSLGVGYRI
jgi:outer membrane protein